MAPGSHSRARAGVERSLLRVGISEDLAHDLIDGASAHTLPLAPRLGLAQAVRTTLAQRIPVAPALPAQGAAIVLVGAGGAGKTACCAALLGAYRSGSTLPASFATLTREEGELQMLLSPQIMKPVPAAGPRAVRALRKSRGAGLALVDTPPLSPPDRAHIRELASLLAKLAPERVLVALPATLGAKAASQLLTRAAPARRQLARRHPRRRDRPAGRRRRGGLLVRPGPRVHPRTRPHRRMADRPPGSVGAGHEAAAMKLRRPGRGRSGPLPLPARSDAGPR